MEEHSFNEMMAGYLEGSLDEHEIQELLKAVESSPSFRKQFQDETRLHVLLREAMSEQVEINLIQESVSAPTSTPRRWFGWLALANAAVLLIICGIYFFSNGDFNRTPPFGVCLNVSGSGEAQIERSAKVLPLTPDVHVRVGDRVICGEHARAMLRLSDGSILSLDKGTQVTLVSARPEINLEGGEVLFEISERKPDEPAFQVHTSQSTVDVMGTVFGLTEDGQTKLEVYEGRVSMIRHSDSKRVEVGSQQTVSTQDEMFAAQEITTSPRRTIRVLPSDDVTFDRGKPARFDYRLKVEADRRVVYLRFVVPKVDNLESATLQLTQEIDAGSGKLQVHVGEHVDWDESNLAQTIAPKAVSVVDEHRGVVNHGQVVELDVTKVVTQPGPLTLILTLNKSGENDIWFGSREGPHPPQLVLSILESQQ